MNVWQRGKSRLTAVLPIGNKAYHTHTNIKSLLERCDRRISEDDKVMCNRREVLKFIMPLLILPMTNLCIVFLSKQSVCLDCFDVGLAFMLLWVSVEEAVFRKLVPWIMERAFELGTKHIALCSSFLFAMFHCFNAKNGLPHIEVLLQVVFAFGVGYCLYALVCICGSIVPEIIIHFLINVTGNYEQYLSPMTIFIWIVLSIACFVYGNWIINNKVEVD